MPKDNKKDANNEQNNEPQNEQNSKNRKPCRLFILDVSVLMIKNNIKSKTEPFPTAGKHKKAGK